MRQLEKHFASETYKAYRAIPFWSWNDRLEPQRLKEQIRWMKESGMGGFFMHARSGLKTEYLSEEWMRCIEDCAKEAKESDMQAWIYDENGWPSGFAGGKLLEDEENRDKYILWNMGQYDEASTVSYFMDGENLKRVNEKEQEGEYLNLYIHTAVATADILNPKVVEQFLNLTHEEYKNRFGEQFSDKIEGFFTDEPQYQRWNTPYTDVMADYYLEEFGEDILDSLGLLFVEKEGYRKFRYRYWKGMQKLMLKNYAEKVYNWCENKHMKLTGHYVEEITMGYQMIGCAGVMPFYEYMHIPGIDWLGKATNYELQVRQVKSVADQLGKKRVLTETFGCCGWDVTPAELKRIAAFQFVNGANLICQHLVPYSERGNRKYDHPAHFSDVNPWIEQDFRTFVEYFNRLGYLLGEGEEQVEVAMLHPMRSAYFEYKRDLQTEGTVTLDASLEKACRTLSGRGIAYHLLDETLLEKHGYVKDGQIGCGKCSYKYLVLPDIYTMDASTEALLQTYINQGGKVLLLGQKPTFLEADTYDYAYLQSNCTLEDLMSAQVYGVTDAHTDIYTTHRILDGMHFIYAVNASCDSSYTQTFDCGPTVRSFNRLDLTDMSARQIGLTLELQPGEDALLFFCEEELEEQEQVPIYELRLHNTKVSFGENCLPLDYVRYSADGITYSKPWPWPALFQKLIKERYEGKLYLKYEFQIKEIPNTLRLRVENSRQLDILVNGTSLKEKVESDAWYINEYDICMLLQEGKNECVLVTDWHEDESVYFAWFGENVTESLRNCVEYDSELQPIELVGDFGVYPENGYQDDVDERYVQGECFYIGKRPEYVNDITLDGMPFLSGEVVVTQTIELETGKVELYIPGEYSMAVVHVNGQLAGELLFHKQLDISKFAHKGTNEITIHFYLSNRNRMGPHHLVGQKDGNVSPCSFGLYANWKEDKCDCYHNYYDLKRFYSK